MLLTSSPVAYPGPISRLFPSKGFPTALAPMQDVTGLPFMTLVANYGAPDLFFTEYFRVHENARIDPTILRSITENSSGKPVFAQLIGEDIEHIHRFANDLQKYPIAGIDLNLGCPAPRVYRKNVGGGLLRNPSRIDEILNVLRSSCECPLTVKTRIGFEDGEKFAEILNIFACNKIDLLSLHARTVKGGYRSIPDYEFVKQAAKRLSCPVLLNGEVNSPVSAIKLVKETGAAGVMIGRSAIRNPWIFSQIRQILNGEDMYLPTLGDLFEYIQSLCKVLHRPEMSEDKLIARLKKFLNFIGETVDQTGDFLHQVRRVKQKAQLDELCTYYLQSNGRKDRVILMDSRLKISPDCCSAEAGCL